MRCGAANSSADDAASSGGRLSPPPMVKRGAVDVGAQRADGRVDALSSAADLAPHVDLARRRVGHDVAGGAGGRGGRRDRGADRCSRRAWRPRAARRPARAARWRRSPVRARRGPSARLIRGGTCPRPCAPSSARRRPKARARARPTRRARCPRRARGRRRADLLVAGQQQDHTVEVVERCQREQPLHDARLHVEATRDRGTTPSSTANGSSTSVPIGHTVSKCPIDATFVGAGPKRHRRCVAPVDARFARASVRREAPTPPPRRARRHSARTRLVRRRRLDGDETLERVEHRSAR